MSSQPEMSVAVQNLMGYEELERARSGTLKHWLS